MVKQELEEMYHIEIKERNGKYYVYTADGNLYSTYGKNSLEDVKRMCQACIDDLWAVAFGYR